MESLEWLEWLSEESNLSFFLSLSYSERHQILCDYNLAPMDLTTDQQEPPNDHDLGKSLILRLLLSNSVVSIQEVLSKIAEYTTDLKSLSRLSGGALVSGNALGGLQKSQTLKSNSFRQKNIDSVFGLTSYPVEITERYPFLSTETLLDNAHRFTPSDTQRVESLKTIKDHYNKGDEGISATSTNKASSSSRQILEDLKENKDEKIWVPFYKVPYTRYRPGSQGKSRSYEVNPTVHDRPLRTNGGLEFENNTINDRYIWVNVGGFLPETWNSSFVPAKVQNRYQRNVAKLWSEWINLIKIENILRLDIKLALFVEPEYRRSVSTCLDNIAKATPDPFSLLTTFNANLKGLSTIKKVVLVVNADRLMHLAKKERQDPSSLFIDTEKRADEIMMGVDEKVTDTIRKYLKEEEWLNNHESQLGPLWKINSYSQNLISSYAQYLSIPTLAYLDSILYRELLLRDYYNHDQWPGQVAERQIKFINQKVEFLITGIQQIPPIDLALLHVALTANEINELYHYTINWGSPDGKNYCRYYEWQRNNEIRHSNKKNKKQKQMKYVEAWDEGYAARLLAAEDIYLRLENKAIRVGLKTVSIGLDMGLSLKQSEKIGFSEYLTELLSEDKKLFNSIVPSGGHIELEGSNLIIFNAQGKQCSSYYTGGLYLSFLLFNEAKTTKKIWSIGNNKFAKLKMALFFDQLTFKYGVTSYLDQYLFRHSITVQVTGKGIVHTLNESMLKTLTLLPRSCGAFVKGLENGDSIWGAMQQSLKVDAKYYKSATSLMVDTIKYGQRIADRIMKGEEKGLEAMLNVVTLGHSKWFDKGIKDVNKVVHVMQRIEDNIIHALLDIPLKLAEDVVDLEKQLWLAAVNHSVSGIVDGIKRDSKGFRHSMTRVAKFVNNLVTDPSKIVKNISRKVKHAKYIYHTYKDLLEVKAAVRITSRIVFYRRILSKDSHDLIRTPWQVFQLNYNNAAEKIIKPYNQIVAAANKYIDSHPLKAINIMKDPSIIFSFADQYYVKPCNPDKSKRRKEENRFILNQLPDVDAWAISTLKRDKRQLRWLKKHPDYSNIVFSLLVSKSLYRSLYTNIVSEQKYINLQWQEWGLEYMRDVKNAFLLYFLPSMSWTKQGTSITINSISKSKGPVKGETNSVTKYFNQHQTGKHLFDYVMWGFFLRRMGIKSGAEVDGLTIGSILKPAQILSHPEASLNVFALYDNVLARNKYTLFAKHILTNELALELVLNTQVGVLNKTNRTKFLNADFSDFNYYTQFPGLDKHIDDSLRLRGLQSILIYDKTQYKPWKAHVSQHHSTFWNEEQDDLLDTKASKTTNVSTDVSTYQDFTFADALLTFEPSVEPAHSKNTTPTNNPKRSHRTKLIANESTSQLTVNVWRAFLQTRGQYHMYKRISGEHAEEKRIAKSLKHDKERKKVEADIKNKKAAIEEEELKKVDAIAEEKAEHTIKHQEAEDIAEVEDAEAEGEIDSELDNAIIDSLIDV